jgi:hypothetical protein
VPASRGNFCRSHFFASKTASDDLFDRANVDGSSAGGEQHRRHLGVATFHCIPMGRASAEHGMVTPPIRIRSVAEQNPCPVHEPAASCVVEELGDERARICQTIAKPSIPGTARRTTKSMGVEDLEPAGVIRGLGVANAGVVNGLTVVGIGAGSEEELEQFELIDMRPAALLTTTDRARDCGERWEQAIPEKPTVRIRATAQQYANGLNEVV